MIDPGSRSVKYAYLIFGLPFPFPRIEENVHHFEKQLLLFEGNVEQEIVGENSKHWSDWLGSIVWESLTSTQTILSTWRATEHPDVTDQENQTLQNQLTDIFRVLPLVGPVAPPDDAFLLSGKGIVSNEILKADDIRNYSKVNIWMKPFYLDKFWDDIYDWTKRDDWRSTFIERWKNIYLHYNRLFNVEQNHRQLLEAYRSFEEAMKNVQLEFKIPNLVRAMESIVDCWGHKDFATKVMYLLKDLPSSLPFDISVDTESLLQILYQLRNDCSHGKPFAYSLEKNGITPDDLLIAKYEFLAEYCARRLITDAFQNPTILEFGGDRDSLALAWKNNQIKPL